MKKQIKVAALACAAIMGAAGLANATAIELNLYGASAQSDFWTATAPKFLHDAYGCTVGSIKTNGKQKFVQGTSCTSVPGGADTINMAWAGVSTVEAIAVRGGATQYNQDAPKDTEGNPILCADPHKRWMNNADNTLSCKTVHIGTTDLQSASVIQKSKGAKNGPAGGTAMDVDWSANGLGLSEDDKVAGTELLVPFALFVNNKVTATQCTAGDASKLGDLCTADTDCGTSGKCETKPISNLTRTQVAQLFSRQVADWSDFGPQYTAMPAVACLRHAGSGTAAAFDMNIISGGQTGWGTQISQTQNTNPALGTVTYFNDSTDTEIGCINGAISDTDTAGHEYGAIGYADADKGLTGISVKTPGGTAYTAANVHQIKYNGAWATSANINNGIYDWYSQGAMYTNSDSAYANQRDMAATLAGYTADSANFPSGKGAYWTTVSNTTFVRQSDSAYVNRK